MITTQLISKVKERKIVLQGAVDGVRGPVISFFFGLEDIRLKGKEPKVTKLQLYFVSPNIKIN